MERSGRRAEEPHRGWPIGRGARRCLMPKSEGPSRMDEMSYGWDDRDTSTRLANRPEKALSRSDGRGHDGPTTIPGDQKRTRLGESRSSIADAVLNRKTMTSCTQRPTSAGPPIGAKTSIPARLHLDRCIRHNGGLAPVHSRIQFANRFSSPNNPPAAAIHLARSSNLPSFSISPYLRPCLLAGDHP